MNALAGPYASLNLALPSIPEELQPQFRALILAIEDYAARQPGYDDLLEEYLDTIHTRLEAGEIVRRMDFENHLVATIALYLLFDPIPWQQVNVRARELRHSKGISAR